jgi:hypothetical protein
MYKPKKKKLSDMELKIKHHIFPEIDYKVNKVISYSQYSTYATCPHRWALKHIEKKEPYQANINTIFGTAFHETLQKFIETVYKEGRTAANNLNLDEILDQQLKENYKKEYIAKGEHFSTAEEMNEYYEDGIAILDWIKKKQSILFSIKNIKLLGIELPLIKHLKGNLYFKAYLDFTLYCEDLKKVYIFDIKTTRYSWNEEQKKDKIKHDQLLLYKRFFSELYNIPIDSIEVEFFIVKRKIYADSEYPQPRVTELKISDGKTSLKRNKENFDKFINDCFDDEGNKIIKEYPKNIGEYSCKWCPFNDKPDLCSKKN